MAIELPSIAVHLVGQFVDARRREVHTPRDLIHVLGFENRRQQHVAIDFPRPPISFRVEMRHDRVEVCLQQ
jgi:hypothetical protein